MVRWLVALVFTLVCALFAVEAFVLPPVTPELKKEAQEYFNNECKGCHRWARKFAAPRCTTMWNIMPTIRRGWCAT